MNAQAGLPDNQSPEAKEGTALHAVAALCLENNQDAIEYVDRVVEDVEIDEAHAEAVQVYLDAIRADKEARGGKLFVETRFHLKYLHDEFFGTSDCARLGMDGILTVYDAKFGRGKIVEVEGNSQLAYYALGAIERFPKTLPINKVELCVVQPRAAHRHGPVRRTTVTHVELLDLAQDLVEAAKEADGDNPRFEAGDHCTFCKAAPTCSTLRNAALDAAQVDFEDDIETMQEKLPKPVAMTPEQIARALDASVIIDTWAKAVWNYAEAEANRGIVIPGFKMVPRQARRKWKGDEVTVANELSLVFGLDENSIFGKKLLSPAQVEKALPKGERHALSDLYSKESSGVKLARDTDPRETVEATAQTDFAD